jgi:hypothetical protein
VYQTTFTVRTLHTLHPNLDELTGKLLEGWATFAENDWIGLRTRVANGGLSHSARWSAAQRKMDSCRSALLQSCHHAGERFICLGSRANGGAAPPLGNRMPAVQTISPRRGPPQERMKLTVKDGI